jgi:SAM-dependent methyltransferase
MAQSQVLGNKESYEVEVEMLHEQGKSTKSAMSAKRTTKSTMAKNLVSACVSLYLAIIDEKYYVNADTKANVIKSYLRLCFAKDSTNMARIYDNVLKTPKKFFVGPQPITLERKNVLEETLGVVSITQGYTVTEKADGERYLLYVDNEGKCYLINNRMTVRYTGVKLNRIVNSIFDGELITRDVFGKAIYMFGMFDAYFNNGVDVRGLRLVAKNKNDDSRLKVMTAFSKQYGDTFKNQGLTLFAKEFKYDETNTSSIFDLSKEFLDRQKGGTFAYQIDGLIYTPMYYAVGALFENDTPNNTATWPVVFKWKPPHDNTIDFLVKFERDTTRVVNKVLKDGKYHNVASLFVGYNPQMHDRLTARKYLSKDVKEVRYSYIPKQFHPDDVVDSSISQAYLPVEETMSGKNVALPKCENGDVIEDNSIVEFSYSPQKGDSLSQHWIPLRVRHDKTEMLHKFGLSGTANDYSTAMNIWRTIQYPVTNDIIIGKKIITKDDVMDDDVYFTSNIDRDKCASIVMKNFHNRFIKNDQLIMMMPKGASVFDIGCGKAGDLNKWIKARFSKVLGFDVVRDNIENRTNGAYARTIDASKRAMFDENKTQFVYFTADASKKVNEDYIEQMEDVDDKYITKIMWGLLKPQQIREQTLHKYYNFAKGGFDVVSTQFCIHYFFETEQTLDNFVYNVGTYLKKGGYFIGTCLDGHAIKEKLKNVKTDESVQGVLDERVIWNIKKLYKKDDKIKIGEQIEVYMESIGKEIKEFLVDFNLLKQKLAAYNIEMLRPEDCQAFGIDKSIESFRYSWNKVQTGSDQSQLAKDVRNMSEQEKEYSFLNSWFIFKKY